MYSVRPKRQRALAQAIPSPAHTTSIHAIAQSQSLTQGFLRAQYAKCQRFREVCGAGITFVLRFNQSPPLRPVRTQDALIQVLEDLVCLLIVWEAAEVVAPGSKRSRRLQNPAHLSVECWELEPVQPPQSVPSERNTADCRAHCRLAALIGHVRDPETHARRPSLSIVPAKWDTGKELNTQKNLSAACAPVLG